MRRFARAKSGTALIEFAIIAPIFIVFFVMIIDIGLVFLSYNLAEKSAFRLARAMMDSSTRPMTEKAAIALVSATNKEDAGFIGSPTKITVNPLNNEASGGTERERYEIAPNEPHVLTISYTRVRLVPIPMLGGPFPKLMGDKIKVTTITVPR